MTSQIISNIRNSAEILTMDRRQAVNALLDRIQKAIEVIYETCPDCGARKTKALPMCQNMHCWYNEEEVENNV
jgi:hypothetical protein